MKLTYKKPRAASWTFHIRPYIGEEKYLVEDAPLDENTRAIYQLVAPLREWLAENRHKMEIDRGDFGEGAEHFNITFTSKTLADEFSELCSSLKK